VKVDGSEPLVANSTDWLAVWQACGFDLAAEGDAVVLADARK
jgi:hypothetical protein